VNCQNIKDLNFYAVNRNPWNDIHTESFCRKKNRECVFLRKNFFRLKGQRGFSSKLMNQLVHNCLPSGIICSVNEDSSQGFQRVFAGHPMSLHWTSIRLRRTHADWQHSDHLSKHKLWKKCATI
jgi:hypothetical protein